METIYCVYGYVYGEGSFNEVLFKQESDARRFHELWQDDMGYMDEVYMVQQNVLGNYGQGMSDSELRDLVELMNS